MSYKPPYSITSKILNLVSEISGIVAKLEIYDPKNDPKKRLNYILDLIQNDKFITIKELSEKLNISEKTIKRDISKLKEQNRLQRVGKKGGYWVVD